MIWAYKYTIVPQMLWGKKEEVEEIQFSVHKQSFSIQNILAAASTYLAQE